MSGEVRKFEMGKFVEYLHCFAKLVLTVCVKSPNSSTSNSGRRLNIGIQGQLIRKSGQ